LSDLIVRLRNILDRTTDCLHFLQILYPLYGAKILSLEIKNDDERGCVGSRKGDFERLVTV
jgi:hypothetical protein